MFCVAHYQSGEGFHNVFHNLKVSQAEYLSDFQFVF